MVRNMFGDKKQMPRWKTAIKGVSYECRNCGYLTFDVKDKGMDKFQKAFLEKKEKEVQNG
jgi:hypothetical protein